MFCSQYFISLSLRGLVANYGALDGRNTGIPVILEHSTGTLFLGLGRVERTGLTYVNRVGSVLWHSSS